MDIYSHMPKCMCKRLHTYTCTVRGHVCVCTLVHICTYICMYICMDGMTQRIVLFGVWRKSSTCEIYHNVRPTLWESGDSDDICVTRVLHFVGSDGLLDA